MGLKTILLFETDSDTPKEVILQYNEMVDDLSCSNGHAFYFYIQKDSAYPILTEYLVSLGVNNKCLIHVTW